MEREGKVERERGREAAAAAPSRGITYECLSFLKKAESCLSRKFATTETDSVIFFLLTRPEIIFHSISYC